MCQNKSYQENKGPKKKERPLIYINHYLERSGTMYENKSYQDNMRTIVYTNHDLKIWYYVRK